MTADVHSPQPFGPAQDFDENLAAARWANLLSQYTGRASDKALGLTAMRYLATPAIALSRRVQVGGLLLADDEIARPAPHIVIVGAKSDSTADKLFRLALAIPTSYKRIEWYDASEGPLLNMDVNYPKLPKPAGFVCTGNACSSPAFTTDVMLRRLQRVR